MYSLRWPRALVALAFALTSLDAQAAEEIFSLDGLDAIDDGPAKSDGGSESRVTTFRGYLAEELRVYPADRDGATGSEQLLTEFQVEVDARIQGDLSLRAVPWLLVDALDTDLLRYEPLEGYLRYQTPFFSASVGQLIESWGIADTFNPLDVVNRRDFSTDLFDPKKRGELGARVRWTLPSGAVIKEPTFGLYALPLWRRTPLPTPEQRNYFAPAGTTLDADRSQGPSGLDQLMWGVRFDQVLDTEFISADLQYLAVRGPSRVPLVAPYVSTDAEVFLLPQYYGEWVFGGGFRAVPEAKWWNKLTLKAELAYKRPYVFGNAQNTSGDLPPLTEPDDYFQFVAGFDRVVPALFSPGDQVTLTAEYAGEVGADDDATLLRPFDSDLAVRLFYELGDYSRTTLELRGVFDVEKAEIIAEAVATRQLGFVHDDLKLELRGRYLRPAPDADTLLARLSRNNSSVGVRLQFDF